MVGQLPEFRAAPVVPGLAWHAAVEVVVVLLSCGGEVAETVAAVAGTVADVAVGEHAAAAAAAGTVEEAAAAAGTVEEAAADVGTVAKADVVVREAAAETVAAAEVDVVVGEAAVVGTAAAVVGDAVVAEDVAVEGSVGSVFQRERTADKTLERTILESQKEPYVAT